MPGEISTLSSLFAQTGEKLDNIISILRKEKPSHPETFVWYSNDTLSSFNIEGELKQTLIPGRTNAVKVDIGTTVTSIGSSAFSGCSGLTSITIPDGVTSIGNYAFEYCSGLASITIPDNAMSIGSYAFYGCSGLTSVTIPNSVTSIGSNAFRSCTGLASITIPNGVGGVGDRAFAGCTGLTSIICLATTAPTVQSGTFGSSNSTYTGRNSYSAGTNVLRISTGATGYNASYWNSVLLNSTKCGFHIEYI